MFYLKYINGCDVLLSFGIEDIYSYYGISIMFANIYTVLVRSSSQEYRLTLQC